VEVNELRIQTTDEFWIVTNLTEVSINNDEVSQSVSQPANLLVCQSVSQCQKLTQYVHQLNQVSSFCLRI
jgi:hypothetical protein